MLLNASYSKDQLSCMLCLFFNFLESIYFLHPSNFLLTCEEPVLHSEASCVRLSPTATFKDHFHPWDVWHVHLRNLFTTCVCNIFFIPIYFNVYSYWILAITTVKKNIVRINRNLRYMYHNDFFFMMKILNNL